MIKSRRELAGIPLVEHIKTMRKIPRQADAQFMPLMEATFPFLIRTRLKQQNRAQVAPIVEVKEPAPDHPDQ